MICKPLTIMEIWHGNNVLLSTYFVLGLVLLFASFLSISILISNFLICHQVYTALATTVIANSVNEVSKMSHIFAFSLAYLE